MELVCIRPCYCNETKMLYERGKVYEADDRFLGSKDLMKHFVELNDLPPEQAAQAVKREEARQADQRRILQAQKDEAKAQGRKGSVERVTAREITPVELSQREANKSRKVEAAVRRAAPNL